MTTFKRDCLISMLIPIAILGIFQASIHKFSLLNLVALAITGGAIIFWCIHRFLRQLDDMTWQQQLSCVLHKISSPVLLADINHNITYANDGFHHLPIASALSHLDNLVDMIAIHESKLNNSVKETLDTLTGKFTCYITWNTKAYVCTLIPLFSPTGKRWGTLLECHIKDDVKNVETDNQSDFAKLSIDQVAVPFLFVNKFEEITFLNSNLKMLLLRHQAWIKGHSPQFNVYEPEGIHISQLLKLISLEDKNIDSLTQENMQSIQFADEDYQLNAQTVWNTKNESIGTIIWLQRAVKIEPIQVEQTNVVSKQLDGIIEHALAQSKLPLVILNKEHHIQHASTAFNQLIQAKLAKNENIVEVINTTFPKMTYSLQQALQKNENVTFVAEHYNQICDWNITPIKSENDIEGYIIEIIYPSRQELMALEENADRLTKNRSFTENELRKFTQSLANIKLYQKEKDISVESMHSDEYHHPLIKNSSKLMLQLSADLHKLHIEIDQMKGMVQSTKLASIKPLNQPMQQVNILSNSISRNVNEAKHDFGVMHQELSKLKGLLKEQKGLNQAYIKPISKAFNSTEQALLQTVGFSETVTIVLQQIHENQYLIAQLQDFMSKLARLPKNVGIEDSYDIYQDIVGLLDRVKNALSVSKLKLKDLLMHFEGLNGCWKQAQENLQACLHLGTAIEQSTKRWGSITESAHEHGQQVQDRILQLVELTQKMQAKTRTTEIIQDTISYQESATRHFEKMIIEVDETKKKAEDVLLEGIVKPASIA